jgi:prolyl-tRNA editing enzyme YbaK/EbsC (Cys-tRNA(Pro) deacylase)
MSRERAEADLAAKGFLDHVIRLEALTATVQEAADALGVEPGAIAKTLSFLVGDEPVLILAEGSAKIDNHKFKEQFHTKAKMIHPDEVEQYVGHAPGGVCPFGVKEGVKVYLDESLKAYDTVYPAAGDDHSAVKLTIPELEQVSGFTSWVDVCKEQ